MRWAPASTSSTVGSTGRANAANDFEALEEVDVDGERVFGGEAPEYLK